MRYTLAAYQRHLELYGSDCLLETAVEDLPRHELGQLKALIDSRERTDVFKHGSWQPRRQGAARACAECGLDLPQTQAHG